jgi:hypothetical protein
LRFVFLFTLHSSLSSLNSENEWMWVSELITVRRHNYTINKWIDLIWFDFEEIW